MVNRCTMTAAGPLADFSRRDRATGIAIAIASVTLVGIGLSLSIPLLAFALESRGASGITIGLNTAMGGLATVVVAPLIPRAAAAFGVRPVLFAALALGFATILGFAFVEPLWAWFPLRFSFGMSLAVLFVLSEFWINALAPPASRGLVMGVYATALSLGFGGGPLILAATGTAGLAPYATCAGLFAVAAIPLAFAGCTSPSVERAAAGRGILFFLRIAPTATLAGFIFGAVETGSFTFLPLYGVEVGLSAAVAAGLVSMMAFGNVVSQIPIGLISDRVDRRSLMFALGVLSVAFSIAIPFSAHSTVLLFTLVAAWGGLVGGVYTVALAHLGARFSGVDLATANAAFVVMYSIGLMAGPPVLGAGYDVSPGYGSHIAVTLLLVMFSIVAFWRLRAPATA